MLENHSTCSKVSDSQICPKCYSNNIVKNGHTKTRKQQYHCKNCNDRFLDFYTYKAYIPNLNQQIIRLTKEGLGIRSTARFLEISSTTLLTRIIRIASKIKQPKIALNQTYQVDELKTYIGNKKRPTWVIYALNSVTKLPVCLKVGRRNKKNLNYIVDTLQLSKAKKIVTDKLPMYQYIINKKLHSTKFRGINHIERNHLTLRTHLKRLNRRSICFSKSLVLLSATIKIYFWC